MQPTICRIVVYTFKALNGELVQRPGIVTEVVGDNVSLTVFFAASDQGSSTMFGFVTGALYDPAQTEGTWSWPVTASSTAATADAPTPKAITKKPKKKSK